MYLCWNHTLKLEGNFFYLPILLSRLKKKVQFEFLFFYYSYSNQHLFFILHHRIKIFQELLRHLIYQYQIKFNALYKVLYIFSNCILDLPFNLLNYFSCLSFSITIMIQKMDCSFTMLFPFIIIFIKLYIISQSLMRLSFLYLNLDKMMLPFIVLIIIYFFPNQGLFYMLHLLMELF